MLSVAVLYSDHKPIEQDTPFQLVAPDGTVVSSAAADAGGVVTFDVDPSSLSQVAVRVDKAVLDKRLQERPAPPQSPQAD